MLTGVHNRQRSELSPNWSRIPLLATVQQHHDDGSAFFGDGKALVSIPVLCSEPRLALLSLIEMLA